MCSIKYNLYDACDIPQYINFNKLDSELTKDLRKMMVIICLISELKFSGYIQFIEFFFDFRTMPYYEIFHGPLDSDLYFIGPINPSLGL